MQLRLREAKLLFADPAELRISCQEAKSLQVQDFLYPQHCRVEDPRPDDPKLSWHLPAHPLNH